MCQSLQFFGQVFLNLGSDNFKFHDVMSRQGSAIKYANLFNSEMKEVILEVTVYGGVERIFTTLAYRCSARFWEIRNG